MVTISFCIVNLNAKKVLKECLSSIENSIRDEKYEIIITDNNSSDGSQKMINTFNKDIHIIQNYRNEGYTSALNKGILKSKGKYIVVLNPDTILENRSIFNLISSLKNDSSIGIVGPKVINEDGTFQKSCRRGLAKPKAVFSYFLGLSGKFSKNEKFTHYHLNHLDENEPNEVFGVSGSCMVIKREVVNDIGYFDERYFAYQEDSDYCLMAIKKGWKIFYNPSSKVIHKGGLGGSNTVPMKAIFEWHRSYYKYYFKHFSKDYSFLFNMFYSLIMLLKLLFSQISFIIKS